MEGDPWGLHYWQKKKKKRQMGNCQNAFFFSFSSSHHFLSVLTPTNWLYKQTHTWPRPLNGRRTCDRSLLRRRSQVCSWAMRRWRRTQTGSEVAVAPHWAWPCWSLIGRCSSRTGSSPAPCTGWTHTDSSRRLWRWHFGNAPGNTPRGRSKNKEVIKNVSGIDTSYYFRINK